MVAGRTTIRVEAPARLHLGFLDPGASRGRRFGSIGLALDGIATVVTAAPHRGLTVAGLADARARACVETVLEHYRLPRNVAVTVESAIPSHVGLGSGTQLALATGMAVVRSFAQTATAAELALVLGRGRRSGIGLSLFECGGLVVDGGHGEATLKPPVLSRLSFPPEWRVLLICDRAVQGLSGRAESDAFSALAPLPEATAAHLCHVTLLGLLPAVAEQDFAEFSRSLGELQAVIGDHFADVQSGRYTSPSVSRAIAFAAERAGTAGVGQSSWGPTGFAFVESAQHAAELLALLRHACVDEEQLDFVVCAARNSGAIITAGDQSSSKRVAHA